MRLAPVPLAAVLLVAGCGGGGGGAPPKAGPPAAGPAVVRPAPSPPLTAKPAGRVIRVGAQPDAIVADPNAHRFAVAIHDPSRLALVDSRSGRVRERVAIPVGQERQPAPAVFLVPAETGRRAVAVQPAQRTPPATPAQSAALVLGRAFVTHAGAPSVDVLDEGRPVAHLGTRPAAIASAVGDTRLAVVSSATRRLELYDPRTLRRTDAQPAGRAPAAVAALGDEVYVSDPGGNAVLIYRVSPRLHPVARIALSGAPFALAVDPVRLQLLVTRPALNRLTTIDLTTDRAVRDTATVRQPDAVAVDSAAGTVAVAGRADGLLQLVRIRTG